MPEDPGRNPFWQRFHELQPDVEVVPLPPEPAPRERDVPEQEALADAEESAQHAVRLARALWAPLTGDLEAPHDVKLAWLASDGPAVVRAEVTVRHHGLGDGDIALRVVGAAAHLESHDWLTRRRDPMVPGAHRLVASRHGVTVELAVFPEPAGVVLTVRSTVTEVGELGSRLLRQRSSPPFVDPDTREAT